MRCVTCRNSISPSTERLFKSITNTRRTTAKVSRSFRYFTSLAHPSATTCRTCLEFPNSVSRIDESLTLAFLTFQGAMTIGTFTRSIFFQVKLPLLYNLVSLSQDGKIVMLIPLPIHSVKVKPIRTPCLKCLVPEIKRLSVILVTDHTVHRLTLEKVRTLQHERIQPESSEAF